MNEAKEFYEKCFKQILEETDKEKRELLIECILQDEDIQREIVKFRKDWEDIYPYIYLHDDAIEKAILDVARLLKKPKGEVRSPKGYFINHVFKKKKFGNDENFVCKSYLEIYLDKYKEKYGIFNTVSTEQIEMREMNDLSNTWDDERMQWQAEAIAERHQKYYRDRRKPFDFSVPDVETMTTETDGILDEIEKKEKEKDAILDEIGKKAKEIDIEPMAEEEAEKIEHEIKENPDTIRYFDCSLNKYRQKYFYSEDKAWEDYAIRMNKLFGKNGEYWKYVDDVGMIPANWKDGYKEVETFKYTPKKGKKSYLKVYNKTKELNYNYLWVFDNVLQKIIFENLNKRQRWLIDLYYYRCFDINRICLILGFKDRTAFNKEKSRIINILRNILLSDYDFYIKASSLRYWLRKTAKKYLCEKMQDSVYLYMEG